MDVGLETCKQGFFLVKFDDELWAQVQPLCCAQCYDRRILIFICIGKILFVGWNREEQMLHVELFSYVCWFFTSWFPNTVLLDEFLTWRVYLRPCPVTHHQSENSTGDTDVRTQRFFKVSRPSKVPNEIKKWPCKICCWTQILGCFYEFPDNIVRSAPVHCWMCQP